MKFKKMNFAISKYTVVSLRGGKKVRCGGIDLPKGKKIYEADSGGYRSLGMLELNQIMCEEMKIKLREVYKKRIALLINSHLNEKNLLHAVKTRAVSLIRYIAAFLDWTNKGQKNLIVRLENSRGRALHPKSVVMRIYIKGPSIENGG